MKPTDWREHTHNLGDVLDNQHGSHLHTHGADGKVDTIEGEPYPPASNPMHSRCGLEDCDCEYTIEKLIEALERLCRGHNMRGSDGPCSCSACLTLIQFKKEQR